MSLEMKWEEGKEGTLRCGADPDLKCWCGWCDNSEAWEESTGADLVCLACLSHPFNENGMQCTPPTYTHMPRPLTVLSHTASHRAPPLHSTSKEQTTTRREKVNEDG